MKPATKRKTPEERCPSRAITWDEMFAMVKEHLAAAMDLTLTLEALMDHIIAAHPPKTTKKKRRLKR